MNIPAINIRKHAILLDVDGTLLDLSATPSSVHVPAELLETLGWLVSRPDSAIAFVSGRPVAELDRLFFPLILAAVGGHGAEIRIPGVVTMNYSTDPLHPAMRRALCDLAQVAFGVLVEDKGYSVAVHYRLAPERRPELLERIAMICADFKETAIELLPGKAVFEIKRPAYNKGTGVRELMVYAPFHGRRPIFVGDDVTDEAAFAVMPEFDGISLSVGRTLPGQAGAFPSPAAMRQWLRSLMSTAEPT